MNLFLSFSLSLSTRHQEASDRLKTQTFEWSHDGITLEADQKHVREILKDLELERANGSATPYAVERNNEGNARSDESKGAEPTRESATCHKIDQISSLCTDTPLTCHV